MKRAAVTPVYVIAGFLGSGKTTLLKRALAHELDRGIKPAVLMNELAKLMWTGHCFMHIPDRTISSCKRC